MASPVRVAVYLRVSTTDQTCENQAIDLRRYADARGWTVIEYRDHGISGAKDRRPALDQLTQDAKRRKFDVLAVWRLDRLGRNLRHLILFLDELHALGIGFVSLNEGIDATTAAGRLQLQVLAAIAEFERSRIVERVKAGLARVKREGRRLGRKPHHLAEADLERTAHLSVRKAAQDLGVPPSVLQRARLYRKPPNPTPQIAEEIGELTTA